MATPEKEKTRVKNLKKALEKLPEDLKMNRKDDLLKTIRKDDFSRTISGLHELLKQEISDKEFLEGDKGKSLVLNIKKWDFFEKMPLDFKQSISAFKFEEQKPADKKQGDGKTPPTSAKHSSSDNQGVDSGPAPANQMQKFSSTINVSPIQSTHSPAVARKAKDENDPEIANLKEEMQKLKKELETEKNTVKEQCHLLNDRKKQLEDLEKGGRTKDEKIKEQEDEIQELLKRFEKENKIRTAVENDFKSVKGMAMGLEKQVNDHFVEREKDKKRIDELEAACKNLETSFKKLDKQKYHVEQQANKNMEHMQNILLEEKRKAEDQYKKLLAERDDLRDRFSKLAGKKLQEQNADIADLSDPNRAMKLSERFGQLYDDEWTNAFESLTDKKLGVPLKDAINVLLRLLQECWTFCNNLMATQMGSLQNVFLHPVQNMANFDQKKTGLTDRPRIASKDQLSLQDLRKRVGVSPSVIEEVKQALLADSKTWDKREKKEFDKKHIEACTPYIQKCAEICWLMALHDPPLLMKMDVKQGEKLDTNIYTVYSATGQTIDFLVWPPLYNGSDGGLLSKGVAEPLRVVGKKK